MSKPEGSVRLSGFTVRPIAVESGRAFVAAHHSRLPYLQKGPWKMVLGLFAPDRALVGAAFWHNCSARGLPQDWLELRRMAVSDAAPPNAASFMLGQMRRWIRRTVPGARRLISYQDLAVHTGTIYRAAGWTPTAVSRPRLRDRSKNRTTTNRKYRSDSNGSGVAASAKIRWEVSLVGEALTGLPAEAIEAARALKPTR